MRKYLLGFILFAIFNKVVFSQGTLTGNARINMDFYERDVSIGAIGPNYEVNKTSSNQWFQAIYTNQQQGFEAGIRFDGNYNSILQNPPNPISYYGIGNWYLKKKIDKIELQAGYIYEQYGSGIALRAYEERSLGIDNAIFGIKARVPITENITFKAIAGTQKYQLGYFGSFVKGANLEVSKDINEDIGINAGVTVVNRTLTQEDRKIVDDQVATYPNQTYFQTKYNTYVFQFYNTLRYKEFTWLMEGTYKTPEAMFNALLPNPYFNDQGYNILNTITYAVPKLGVTFQNRITSSFQFLSTISNASDNFNLKTNRRLSYLVPINRQNSLRLPARFQVAPQELGEIASSIDLTYKVKDHMLLNLSLSMVDTLNYLDPYYREVYADMEFTHLLKNKASAHLGAQYTFYNQKLYQQEGVSDVEAYTAFGEFGYKFDRKKSIRVELQYQYAEKEMGQSLFGLVEFNIAPSWSFSVSDLYNFQPNPHYYIPEYRTPHHFYSAFGSYTKGVNRFTLAYVKQLKGIVCTGGVCRVEPAFSGLRAQFTTSF